MPCHLRCLARLGRDQSRTTTFPVFLPVNSDWNAIGQESIPSKKVSSTTATPWSKDGAVDVVRHVSTNSV